MALLMDTNVDISQQFSEANIYHKPFETFSPSYQMDYLYAPAVAIESPGASGSTITTKKEATQTPTTAGIDQTQTADKTISTMDWLLPVVIVGAIAFVLTGYFKKGKK